MGRAGGRLVKRYYLSNVVGTGTLDDPFRLAIEDNLGAAAYVAVISPDNKWGLAYVASADHTRFLNDTRNDGFPAVSLDTLMASVGVGAKNTLQSALTKRGIAIGSLAGFNSVRDCLRAIGRKAEPSFNENAFDTDSSA